MKKRLLSVLLTLSMVLTLLPGTAFAAGYHADTPVTGTTSNVETAYESFYPISDQLNVVSSGWAQTGWGSVSQQELMWYGHIIGEIITAEHPRGTPGLC